MAGCGVILLVTGGRTHRGGDQLAGKGHVVDIDQQQAGIAQQGTPPQDQPPRLPGNIRVNCSLLGVNRPRFCRPAS